MKCPTCAKETGGLFSDVPSWHCDECGTFWRQVGTPRVPAQAKSHAALRDAAQRLVDSHYATVAALMDSRNGDPIELSRRTSEAMADLSAALAAAPK